MIQRIQSFYLLIVTGLLITATCLLMGYLIDITRECPFETLEINVNGIFQSTWRVSGTLILSALVAFAIIFLYKNRMPQTRMLIFNSLLLVGYYIAFIALYFASKSDANPFRIGWVLRLSLVFIALNMLTIRAIGRDEVVVKVADRLQ